MFHVSSPEIFHLFVFFSCFFFLPSNLSLGSSSFLNHPCRPSSISYLILIVLMVFFFAIEIQSFCPSPYSFCAHRFSLSLSHHGSCNKRAIAIFWKKQKTKKKDSTRFVSSAVHLLEDSAKSSLRLTGERKMDVFIYEENLVALNCVGWYKFIATFERKCVLAQFQFTSWVFESVSLPVCISPYKFFRNFS